jgi:hypothetical protein
LMGLFKGKKLFSSEGLPWLKRLKKGGETQ